MRILRILRALELADGCAWSSPPHRTVAPPVGTACSAWKPASSPYLLQFCPFFFHVTHVFFDRGVRSAGYISRRCDTSRRTAAVTRREYTVKNRACTRPLGDRAQQFGTSIFNGKGACGGGGRVLRVLPGVNYVRRMDVYSPGATTEQK